MRLRISQKIVLFSDKTNDKDRSRSDYSKCPRDDALKEGQDSKTMGIEALAGTTMISSTYGLHVLIQLSLMRLTN
jgi:hypothetical protein